jgi:hypothetical protein
MVEPAPGRRSPEATPRKTTTPAPFCSHPRRVGWPSSLDLPPLWGRAGVGLRSTRGPENDHHSRPHRPRRVFLLTSPHQTHRPSAGLVVPCPVSGRRVWRARGRTLGGLAPEGACGDRMGADASFPFYRRGRDTAPRRRGRPLPHPIPPDPRGASSRDFGRAPGIGCPSGRPLPSDPLASFSRARILVGRSSRPPRSCSRSGRSQGKPTPSRTPLISLTPATHRSRQGARCRKAARPRGLAAHPARTPARVAPGDTARRDATPRQGTPPPDRREEGDH